MNRLPFGKFNRVNQMVKTRSKAKNPVKRKTRAKKKPTRAGHYGPGFAGNPWRDGSGRFCSKSRDADGQPYSTGTSKPKDPYWDI